MIVVDSSALVAIFEQEAGAAIYANAILQADRLMISAVNVHETGMVMRARRGEEAERNLWRFLLADNDFEIVPFDEAQAREALAAFGRYGKGIDPKAKLNLSDCAASPNPWICPCCSRTTTSLQPICDPAFDARGQPHHRPEARLTGPLIEPPREGRSEVGGR